jgi:hypothetical protein
MASRVIKNRLIWATVGSMPITIKGAPLWHRGRKYDLRGKERSPFDLGR